MPNIPHNALKKLRQNAKDNYKHQETAIKTKEHKVLKKLCFRLKFLKSLNKAL